MIISRTFGFTDCWNALLFRQVGLVRPGQVQKSLLSFVRSLHRAFIPLDVLISIS